MYSERDRIVDRKELLFYTRKLSSNMQKPHGPIFLNIIHHIRLSLNL